MSSEKHIGKASASSRRMLWKSVILLCALVVGGAIAQLVGTFLVAITGFVVFVWIITAAFILYFFRDPSPLVPDEAGAIVSPGHGTVDFVGEGLETEYLGGRCKRVSIFLSIFNVHVQNAPVAGTVEYLKHTPGQFINAMKLEAATANENLLIGFAAPSSRKIAVRLISGLIARRIVPWIQEGETVELGERISLIQFGSRVEIYLPLEASITVRPGDKVIGGETILAKW